MAQLKCPSDKTHLRRNRLARSIHVSQLVSSFEALSSQPCMAPVQTLPDADQVLISRSVQERKDELLGKTSSTRPSEASVVSVRPQKPTRTKSLNDAATESESTTEPQKPPRTNWNSLADKRDAQPAVEGVLALIILLFGDIYTLITYYAFIRWTGVGAAVAALLILRWRKPDLPRPFKTPLIFPILFFLACVFLVVMQFYTNPYNPLIGIALSLTGLPFYFLCVRRTDKPAVLERVYGAFLRRYQQLFQVCLPDKTPDL